MSDMFGVLADFGKDIYSNWEAGNRQEDMQNFNQQEGATTRAFNSAEALANRDWQERMSNTSVQRHKADLLAAGFNPLLAIHPGGGASTPSGGQASTGIPSAGTASPGGTHSVSAGLATASQINVNEAQAEKLRAETNEVKARTPRHEWDIEEIKARIPVHHEQVNELQQRIAQSSVEIERIWQDISHSQASAKHLDQQVINLKQTIPQIKAQIDNLKALTAQASAATDEIKQRVKENLPQMERILMNLTRIQGEMAQPGHANAERAQDSLIGQIGAYLKAILPLNSVIGAVPLGRSGAAKPTDERQRWKGPK